MIDKMFRRMEILLKRLISVVCVILVLVTGFSISVSAEPTDAFTHIDTQSGIQVSVKSKEMYKSTKMINATSLGLEKSLMGLSDLCSDKDGNVYLLIGQRSQIVVLDKNYSYLKTISVFDENGNVSFDGAQGIYVDNNGEIYICDTNNSRIIVALPDGMIKEYMDTPDSALLPDDFYYQPYRIAKDDKGYTYIISTGCYYGALAYSPSGEFLGFYGANNVKTSALDTLSFLWDKLTQTDEKKKVSVKLLPYSFVDLALDKEGYMVTCTGKTETDDNGVGQIRKLSPGGGDILYKRNIDGTSASSSSFNFLENEIKTDNGNPMVQNVVSVDTDNDNFIYALDQTHRLIYVYDNECNMLGGFGGGNSSARQLGIFNNPVSLLVHGDAILVADSENMSVTVFELTEYGRVLKEAQNMYILGNYEDSEELWHEVLSFNRNCQLAYRGLAMSALVEGRYEEALEYAELGIDYNVYDMAHSEILSRNINKYFVIIFPVCIFLIVGLIVLFVKLKKRNKVLISNIKVRTALSTIVHPFDAYNDVKYKGLGSVVIAGVLCALFYLSQMLEKTAAGFLYLKSSPSNYNMLYTILGSVGLVLLWSLANWLVACLADGKGTFKEVFIVTNYVLIPCIAFKLIMVVLSHFLPLSGLSVMNGIWVVILIYSFFLLSVAMMAIHEYDFFKFLTTSIVSILLMILVVFVVFLVVLLWQQLSDFAKSIYTEIFYR